MLLYKNLLDLNNGDNDNVLLVNAFTKDVIGFTSCLDDDFNRLYFNCKVKHVGYSTDIKPCNLLIFIEV